MDLLEILQRMVVPFTLSVIKYLLSKVINALTIYSSPNSRLREVSDICQYIISLVKLFFAYSRISFCENYKLDVLKFSIIGKSKVHSFCQFFMYQNTTYPLAPVTKYFQSQEIPIVVYICFYTGSIYIKFLFFKSQIFILLSFPVEIRVF